MLSFLIHLVLDMLYQVGIVEAFLRPFLEGLSGSLEEVEFNLDGLLLTLALGFLAMLVFAVFLMAGIYRVVRPRKAVAAT